MANKSLSVVLANGCCNRNYWLSKVVGSVVWFRGRKYHWEVTKTDTRFDLYCNNRLIGDFYIDEILIYEEKSIYITTQEELLSLIAMFNLFPC